MAGDPVAEKSAFLRMYMSNHPDTLVAYAKWYGKVSEPISSAEMSAIDTKGMTLSCKMKDGKTKDVRVPIEPPMTGYDDVKPRLLEMKAIAQEDLEWYASLQVPFIVLPLLAYFAYAPVNDPSPLYLPARALATGFSGSPTLSMFSKRMYTWSLCRRHGTGFLLGSAYVASTLVCGYHIWRDLRKQIQDARIESVMKIE
ncbi:hypothetical protein BT96DRAFT_958752 [Gymnopus androsaceus JB14]|uniref:DUF2470 domain-containing protein n=1 Tax=Gymnopus androsaceus JB14 TaxID=1447944 RepID=A0A6A4HAF8_9AGAR|nr:hypothetical protein BT96DRAFT_958752 [Gymnopus androsaceus JB14]